MSEQLKFWDIAAPSKFGEDDPSFRCLDFRERLARVLKTKLDFQGEKTGYATHYLHSFAAKFPPQLPKVFIRALSEPGDTVLDPFMGSGTTLVEALLEDRQAIGVDLDPLAFRITTTKTTKLNSDEILAVGRKVLSEADLLRDDQQTLMSRGFARFDQKTREFIDYWFLEQTQRELMALVLAIEEVEPVEIRRFLELTLSSIIIAKSGGVSMARDLAHSRPHIDKKKQPKSPLGQFAARLTKNLSGLSSFNPNGNKARIILGDARDLPLEEESVDLVVTSPPYANAIDYMRSHKFSLVWLGKCVKELAEKRAEYVGSERLDCSIEESLPSLCDQTINELQERDKRKSQVLRKYFLEMKQVLREMCRVLRKGRTAVVVVGTSNMKGINVQTHNHLADIGESVGFEAVDVVERALDRNRRMMPARFGKKSDSVIEQRMHQEYVIGLFKPS